MLTLHRRQTPGRDAMDFGADGDDGHWCIEGWPCHPRRAVEATVVVLQAVYALTTVTGSGPDRAYGTLNFGPYEPDYCRHHFRVEPTSRMGHDSLPVAVLGHHHVAMFMPGGAPWWCNNSAALAGVVAYVFDALTTPGSAGRGGAAGIWPAPGQDTDPGAPWAPLLVDLRYVFERVREGKRPLPIPRAPATRRAHPDQLGLF